MFIIEYLQTESLIYRDLKPNNFIVDEEKRVILIDFDRMIGLEKSITQRVIFPKTLKNLFTSLKSQRIQII